MWYSNVSHPETKCDTLMSHESCENDGSRHHHNKIMINFIIIQVQSLAKDWHILCVLKTWKMCQSLAYQFLTVFSRFFGPEIDIFKILRPFSKKECFWRNKVIKTFTGLFNLLEPSQNHMDIMWQWHLSMSFRREIPFSPPKMTIRFSPPKPYQNLHQNP